MRGLLRSALLTALAFLALWGQRDLIKGQAWRAYVWYTTEEPLTPPARVLIERLADPALWEASGHCDGRVVTLTSRGGGPGAVSVDVPGRNGLKVLQGNGDVTPLLTTADRKRVREAALGACEAVLARERTRLAGRLERQLSGGGEALARGTR
jgi:hypothetical protein